VSVCQNNKFGIRVRVPDELREVIGKREITRSLGTGDPVEGRRAYHEKLAEVQSELDAARHSLNPPEPAPLSVDKAESIATPHFQEQIYIAKLEAHRVANDARSDAEQLRHNCGEWLVEIARDLQDVRFDGERYVVGLAYQPLREQVQAIRGRTIWFTTKRPGTYSSSSVTSSPSVFSDPPQVLHSPPGDRTCSLRCRCPGSGLRRGYLGPLRGG